MVGSGFGDDGVARSPADELEGAGSTRQVAVGLLLAECVGLALAEDGEAAAAAGSHEFVKVEDVRLGQVELDSAVVNYLGLFGVGLADEDVGVERPFAVLGVPRPLPVLGGHFAPTAVVLDAPAYLPGKDGLLGVVGPVLSKADEADAGIVEPSVVDGVEDAPSVDVVLRVICELTGDHVGESDVGVCDPELT